MRRLVRMLPISLVLLAPSSPLTADAKAEEATCGQELAADAEVPDKLGALMSHVGANMEAHARWVGASAGGAREQKALRAVAREYKAMADAAARASAAMKAMKAIPPVAHDPARLDRGAQIAWMRKKIAMQVEFANLLTTHAETSMKVLAALEGKGQPSAVPAR